MADYACVGDVLKRKRSQWVFAATLAVESNACRLRGSTDPGRSFSIRSADRGQFQNSHRDGVVLHGFHSGREVFTRRNHPRHVHPEFWQAKVLPSILRRHAKWMKEENSLMDRSRQ